MSPASIWVLGCWQQAWHCSECGSSLPPPPDGRDWETKDSFSREGIGLPHAPDTGCCLSLPAAVQGRPAEGPRVLGQDNPSLQEAMLGRWLADARSWGLCPLPTRSHQTCVLIHRLIQHIGEDSSFEGLEEEPRTLQAAISSICMSMSLQMSPSETQS